MLFSNMVFIGYILQGYEQADLSKIFQQFTDKDPLTYLKDFHKNLDDFDPEDLDISVLLGMTEVSFCLLLLQEDGQEDQTLLDEINKRFSETFSLLHSTRQIRIEIAQIDFLLSHPQVIDQNKQDILSKIREALLRYN